MVTLNYERKIQIGNRFIGDNEPVFIIAEIGINHNGSVDIAKKMIEGALYAECCKISEANSGTATSQYKVC